jgi:hypothetical protein
MLLNHSFVFVARVQSKDSANNDAFAGKLIGAFDAFVYYQLHLKTSLCEACHEGAALLIGEEAEYALGYLLAYLVDGNKFVEGGSSQVFHRTKSAGEFLGYGLTYEADADGEEYAFERHFT